MATWPATLQQCPESSGYTEMERDTVIRSQMGYGPGKYRKRVTVNMLDISGFIYLYQDEMPTLEQFYADNGSIPFDWIDFQTGDPASYRFKAPPTYRAVGGELYTATLSLERMP